MSTSPQSRDEYEEEGDSGRGRVNTDNNIDTNLTNLDGEEDRVDTDQLLSHATIETVQYEDFVKEGKIAKIEEEEPNIEVIELDDDDDEEEDEDSSPQVKRYRTTIEDIQLKVEQVITVTLQCPQVDCLEMMATLWSVAATDKFNDHMLKRHSIRPHRCLVKDCAQSFNHKLALSEHIKQSHRVTTEWHCDHCPRHFPSYNRLSQHNIQQHQLGYFQCAFPLCPLVAIHKRNVHDHYRRHHKTEGLKKCLHPGCLYQTRVVSHFKQHQLAHLGLKPYKCKWAHCDFAATQRSNTIGHIRSVHLKDDPSSNGIAQLGDPKDYVEVVRELL